MLRCYFDYDSLFNARCYIKYTSICPICLYYFFASQRYEYAINIIIGLITFKNDPATNALRIFMQCISESELFAGVTLNFKLYLFSEYLNSFLNYSFLLFCLQNIFITSIFNRWRITLTSWFRIESAYCRERKFKKFSQHHFSFRPTGMLGTKI